MSEVRTAALAAAVGADIKAIRQTQGGQNSAIEAAQQVAGNAAEFAAQAENKANEALVIATPHAGFIDALAAAKPAIVIRVAALINRRVIEWIRQIGGPCLGGGWIPAGDITPEHFGASGDGTANDTGSVEAAFSYCAATSKDVLLYSRYRGAFETPQTGRVFIRGTDAAELISGALETRAATLRHRGTNMLHIEGVRFRDAGASASRRAIMIDASRQTKIIRCDFRSLPGACIDQLGGDEAIVRDCYFEGMAASNCISFRGAGGVAIGNTFRDCDGHCVRWGILFSDTVGPERGYYAICNDNVFEDVGNDAILMEINARYVTVQGNIGHRIRSLIKVHASSASPPYAHQFSIMGNIAVGQIVAASDGTSRGACIKVETASENAMIHGNIVDGFEVGIQGGTGASVVGNTVRGATGTAAIRLLGERSLASHNIISGGAATWAIWATTKNKVDGNDITNTGGGIRAEGARIRVSGNRVSCSGAGVFITSDAVSSIITGNDLLDVAGTKISNAAGASVVQANNIIA